LWLEKENVNKQNMNRKAVVTGATKGIGRAIAEALATEGYDLAVCSRTENDLEALKNDFALRFPYITVFAKVVDMSKKDQVIEFGKNISENWQKIDVLVNNAGAFSPGGILESEDLAIEQMIDTNLYSAYFLTKTILPLMLSHKKGHIFNMCSVASLDAYKNGENYSISKFALLGFSKNLREELKPKGIKVTAILPGPTWSESWAGFDAPPERLMQPRDIAEVVLAALKMSSGAVIEDIVLRPLLGDIGD
jgi:short-subunit dehydrogenase